MIYLSDIETKDLIEHVLLTGQAEFFRNQLKKLIKKRKEFSKKELSTRLLDIFSLIIGEEVQPIDLGETFGKEDNQETTTELLAYQNEA